MSPFEQFMAYAAIKARHHWLLFCVNGQMNLLLEGINIRPLPQNTSAKKALDTTAVIWHISARIR